MYENSAWHQRSVSHMFFPTLDSDRFSKLDKERFPPRSNLTRNKALEKKEDKTISLICSSFFQMIKRRKMMSSLIPCLSSVSIFLALLRVIGTGVPGFHVHPLYFLSDRTKKHTEFCNFSWLLSVVHPLILGPCYGPVTQYRIK